MKGQEMERPIIQTNEAGKQIITALVDVARKTVPLQEVPSLMAILGMVTLIPPQEKLTETEAKPAEG
jgi:hypothetical protein